MTIPSWSLRYYSASAGNGYAPPQCTQEHSVAVLVADDFSNEAPPLAGERLHQLFAETVLRLHNSGNSHAIALEYSGRSYEFAEIEALSIQLSHFLSRQGICAGERVGLLLERSVYSVLAMLALSRLDCAYIPLDADFPTDRIEYMLHDCAATRVLILNKYEERLKPLPVSLLSLDELECDIRKESSVPLESAEFSTDSLCYVIYTSGTTGRPKGVPINHDSICNFIRVATRSYGYEQSDRVYQGMTIAFDFSVEELWVPLIVGATIVPNEGNTKLLGPDLTAFLRNRQINALCCVPTLLATLDPSQLELRFIMVSGEPCPPALAVRWASPHRRFLNTYGPTEATVSATWQVISDGDSVNIGGPLDTYSIVILAPDEPRALPPGEAGEIAIAGIGLSTGYLNLPEKTATVFVEDFVGIDNNPGRCLYRTGDIGRITENNTIECLGRVDAQVKIRGYRVELDEIESITMEIDSVAQAVVDIIDLPTGHKELALFLTPKTIAQPIDVNAVSKLLRQRMPAYMVPAFVDVLDELPLLPSGKVDRKSIQPTGQRLISSNNTFLAPAHGLQTQLADWLIKELSLDSVSADAHFFNDLGADSILMTRFVAHISTRLPDILISIDQLYQNPSIIQLAQSMEEKAVRDDTHERPDWLTDLLVVCEQSKSGVPTWQYWACGFAQLSAMTAGTFLFIYLNSIGLHWIEAAGSITGTYTRAVLVCFCILSGLSLCLIALKWIAIGRFREESIPVWSFRYFRFWLARAAIRSNPLNLTRGSFLYTLFLRSLGAQIGKHCHFHAEMPICTDLISIGDESLVREKVVMSGYSCIDGYVHCGPVSIGSHAFVGPASVLDIATAVGDNAQLGMTSALHPGQSVPDGCRFHGSPAAQTETNHDRLPPRALTPWQRVADGLSGPLLLSFLLSYPLVTAFIAWAIELDGGISLADHIPSPSAPDLLAVTTFLLVVSLTTYFGFMLLQMLRVLIVPRLLRPFMITGVVHSVFSFQYQLARTMSIAGNSKWLCQLFGDSSMILHYLSAIGYDMREATQTGSNCGVVIAQTSPFLCQFRRNTLASDGLTLMNMELSYSSFVLKHIEIHENSYLGNAIHYPTDAKLGNNCLIATKAMIPIDGPVRENTGILGSPPFEIPRTVDRDRQFDHLKSPEVLPERLQLKLQSNLRTLGLHMFKSCTLVFSVVVLAAVFTRIAAVLPHDSLGLAVAVTGFVICSIAFTIGYSILFEHIAQSFKPMTPKYCSLYDEEFWTHERFWKLSSDAFPIMEIFNGTPIKPILQRLRGLKAGRQTFDDGCSLSEPKLVKLGDGCTLNARSNIQAHSLEDGTFKSDRVQIGNHCSLGTGAFVHYGCDIGDGALLLNDSFLMKGSTMQQGSVWGGNPAGKLSMHNSSDKEPDYDQPARVLCWPLTAGPFSGKRTGST